MNTKVLSKKSSSVEETLQIAVEFINSLKDKNCILLLSGDLGAGKTHFTKGIFRALGYKNYNDVLSPTFDLVNTFEIENLVVHHFDLYRLDKLTSDDQLWLYELLNQNGLSIIEWGNKFDFQINKKIYLINIEIITENERQIKIFTN